MQHHLTVTPTLLHGFHSRLLSHTHSNLVLTLACGITSFKITLTPTHSNLVPTLTLNLASYCTITPKLIQFLHSHSL